MILLIVCLVAIVVALFVALILGYPGSVSTHMTGGPRQELILARVGGEDGPLDLEAVRFDRAARGYRMDQVDALMEALLRERRGESAMDDNTKVSEAGESREGDAPAVEEAASTAAPSENRDSES